VSSDAPAVVRQAMGDPRRATRWRDARHVRGGKLRWGHDALGHSLPPENAQALPYASDDQIKEFLKIVAQREILLTQADSAHVQLRPEDWQQLIAQHDTLVAGLANALGLTPQALRDAAASPSNALRWRGSRERLSRPPRAGRAPYIPINAFSVRRCGGGRRGRSALPACSARPTAPKRCARRRTRCGRAAAAVAAPRSGRHRARARRPHATAERRCNNEGHPLGTPAGAFLVTERGRSRAAASSIASSRSWARADPDVRVEEQVAQLQSQGSRSHRFRGLAKLRRRILGDMINENWKSSRRSAIPASR